MFTGIIEELGEVAAVQPRAESARLTVRGPQVSTDAHHGDSIAVNGVCLTVVDAAGDSFTADVMKETLDRSSLGDAQEGTPVNLERPVAAGGRFGGHIVQGHVDGTGRVVERVPGEHWEVLRVSLPAELTRYVVEKGSITVDGVSLTVAGVSGADFTVGLVPTTLRLTTLGRRAAGESVNLEVDVIGKYVAQHIDHYLSQHLGGRVGQGAGGQQ